MRPPSAARADSCFFVGIDHLTTIAAPERWVLLFDRDKADPVARNMTSKNPAFVAQLDRNLRDALTGLTASTPDELRYEVFLARPPRHPAPNSVAYRFRNTAAPSARSVASSRSM